MPEKLPRSVEDLRKVIETDRPIATASAETKKIAELRFITDALLVLTELLAQKSKN